MKVPYTWIGELVDCQAESIEALARTLTGIGLEAEPGEGLPCTFSGVIAVRIEQSEPRGKGSLLTVSSGTQIWQVYSTAPGIGSGKCYAFAPPGATVGGARIEATAFEVEGTTVPSAGMMCSAEELGVGRESHDLLELPGLDPGTDLKSALFTDRPIESEYPSNRGDVLSLHGVARELGVHFQSTPRAWEISKATGVEHGSEREVVHGGITIGIADLDLCPRYAARVIREVRIDDSPPELIARLTSLGLKPINNIADITNVVLAELGQPLHAFDLDRLTGNRIHVRRATAGETLETLDGSKRTFDARDLLICDGAGPVAIAGVMGGKASEVGWGTTTVLLESARFDKVAIRRTAKRQGIRTEASLHFERGIDPALVEMALDRVAWYVERFGIGRVEPLTISVGVPDPPLREIACDPARINQLLGTALPEAVIRDILARLGFTGTETLTVPSWRSDILLIEDLAEEVARHHSYNQIPIALPEAPMKGQVLPDSWVLRSRVKRTTAGMGFRELLTFPLGDAQSTRLVNPLREGAQPIQLANPLSVDQSVLQINLLGGFLAALRQNFRTRGRLPLAMEINRVYWQTADQPGEADELALMVVQEPGKRAEEQAFLALKGVVDTLFEGMHIEAHFHVHDWPKPPFATGMVGHYHLGGAMGPEGVDGFLGVVDPQLVAQYDVPYVVAFAQFKWEEVVAEAIRGRAAITFEPLSRFPAVERDLALVADEAVLYGTLKATIEKHGGRYLTRVGLFDVFRGKQVPTGKKSLAFNLTFQNPEATLTDDEVNSAMAAVIQAAQAAHGAQLRT